MKKQNAIMSDPLVIGLSLLSALLLLLSAKLPWWHVIGLAEPSYVRTARFFSLLPAFGACLAIALPRRCASFFVIGGLLATLLPGVIILLIVTRDPDSIGAAVYQTDQANRLINDLTRTSLNAEVPWTERVALASDGLQRSDYTFVDGVESALHFAKGGWYAGCLGGLTLLLAAWAWDGEAALGTIRRCRWVFGAAGLGLAAFGFVAVSVRAREPVQSIEHRLDEVFRIAGLLEHLHFLAQAGCPRLLVGKRGSFDHVNHPALRLLQFASLLRQAEPMCNSEKSRNAVHLEHQIA